MQNSAKKKKKCKNGAGGKGKNHCITKVGRERWLHLDGFILTSKENISLFKVQLYFLHNKQK